MYSMPITKLPNQVLPKGLKFSIALSKLTYSEVIANIEGNIEVMNIHDSRAEAEEIAEARAHFVETLLNSPSVHNLNLKLFSKNERLVLRSLHKDHSTIITKVDKGNTVVVTDSDDYDKKVSKF